MKTNLANTESFLLRYDKEIEKENKEILKLEEANNRLKIDTDKNNKIGENLVLEMGAVEEEKKRSREALDNRRNTFNQLKRELQRVEDEETKAKASVEEAMKQRNLMDD
jgi:chromosome segregation ATPase